jgi:hypothetical protein
MNSQSKEMKTMKYETPEVVALSPAVNAIRGEKLPNKVFEVTHDIAAAYEDWE